MAEATKVYLNPTAAPTLAVALGLNTVVATVQPADTGDTAQITHAFNLSAADLALGWPTINIESLRASAAGANWTIVSFADNYVGLLKNNSTASGDSAAQIKVYISRPHSIVK